MFELAIQSERRRGDESGEKCAKIFGKDNQFTKRDDQPSMNGKPRRMYDQIADGLEKGEVKSSRQA